MAATISVYAVLLLVCLQIAEAEAKTKFGQEKISLLHFYFHDVVSGKNVMTVQVARAPTTNTSPTFFGMVVVMDDWLTASRKDQRRPLKWWAERRVSTFHQAKRISICSWPLRLFSRAAISTLAMVGKNAALEEVREMPIVGGSGLFRLARGYALAHTHSIDMTSAVVEYNVTVLHY